MGEPLKNARFELVALGVLAGMPLEQIAHAAGYMTKYAYNHVSRITRYPEVQARIKELQAEAASDKMMSVTQRLEWLSEIARARYDDPDRAGDPIAAIHQLNLMDGVYRNKGKVAAPGATKSKTGRPGRHSGLLVTPSVRI